MYGILEIPGEIFDVKDFTECTPSVSQSFGVASCKKVSSQTEIWVNKISSDYPNHNPIQKEDGSIRVET